MTGAGHNPSIEDVLDAFAVESSPDRGTLERYQRRYPYFAAALAELAHELWRSVPVDVTPITDEDAAYIDAAWSLHVAAGPEVVVDPFAALSVTHLRDLAKALDVPRQVITAFRDRKVIISSVPRRFLGRLATELNSSLDWLLNSLAAPAPNALARSYKADVKPSDKVPVTFERILADAGVPDDKRAQLLAEAD